MHVGGYHEYRGGGGWGVNLLLFEHPHGTQDIPYGTYDIPYGTQDIPHGTYDIPHGTEHTLYRVILQVSIVRLSIWPVGYQFDLLPSLPIGFWDH